jgi:hypothetical protein
MEKINRKVKRLTRALPCNTESKTYRWNMTERNVTARMGKEALTGDVMVALSIGSFDLHSVTFCEGKAGEEVFDEYCDSGCSCRKTLECETVFIISDLFTFRTYQGRLDRGDSEAAAGLKATADGVLMMLDNAVWSIPTMNFTGGKDFYMVGYTKPYKHMHSETYCTD